MLVTGTEEVDFVEVFKHKFVNFCGKSPALISFEIERDGVYVKEQGSGKNNTFKFDYSQSVKHNIKIIKDWLIENVYPVMIQEKKEYVDYTSEELEKIMDETGVTPEQVVLMKKELITPIKWRIEKIIVKKDELFCRNLSTDKQYRFRMNLPSTIFLKKLRETWAPQYGYTVFEKKSFLLNEIYPNIEEE